MDKQSLHLMAAVWAGAFVRNENDSEYAQTLSSGYQIVRSQMEPHLLSDDRPVMFTVTGEDLNGALQPGILLMTETRAIHVQLKLGWLRTKALPATVAVYSEIRRHELGVGEPTLRESDQYVPTGSVEPSGWRVNVLDNENSRVAATVLGLIAGTVTPKFGDEGIESFVFDS